MQEKDGEKPVLPVENPDRNEKEKQWRNLEEFLCEKAVTENEVVDLMIDLCRELEKREEKKVPYGEICPENILITEENRAELRILPTREETEEEGAEDGERSTDSYLAPEIVHGQCPDRRTDLYELGMVFYRIMNRGREPFVSLEKQIVGYKDRQEAQKKRLEGRKLPAPADTSGEFARILLKVCEFQPGKRYRNAAGLRKALEKCRRSREKGWSTAGKAVAAAVLLAILCGGGIGIWQQMPCRGYRDPETGDRWSISRNGTLTLEGEGAYNMFVQSPDNKSVIDEVKKLVVYGNVRHLNAGFSSCSSLEKVVLQEGLETVGNSVFYCCDRIQEVSFPSTLKEISDGAFSGCKSLEQIELPEGLERIGYSAFQSCTSLSEIKLPSTVTYFGGMAFMDTPWMEEQKTKGDYLVKNGVLIEYFGEEETVDLTQDSEICSVAPYAFRANMSIQTVILPDIAEEFGKEVFYGCESLKFVKFPLNLKELPESTFAGCKSLEKVILPDGVEKIGRCAFRYAENLKTIEIPESVTCIEEETFIGTPWYDALTEGQDYAVWNGFLLECLIDEEEIVIPEDLGIRRIADYAFAHKKKLRKAVIPEGVVSLGEGCFFFCEQLETIEFPESLKEFGRGPMAATRWMKERAAQGGPVLVNGIDVSY